MAMLEVGDVAEDATHLGYAGGLEGGMSTAFDVLDDGSGREPFAFVLAGGYCEMLEEIGLGIRGNLETFIVLHHALRLGIGEPVAGAAGELIDSLSIELFVVDATGEADRSRELYKALFKYNSL